MRYVTPRTEELVRIYALSEMYVGCAIFAQHASTDLWLIDICGRLVVGWAVPSPLGSGLQLLPNGNHSRLNRKRQEPTVFLGTVGGILAEVDWKGNAVWQHLDQYMHHDFCFIPNGNFLLNRHVEISDAIARRVRDGIPQTTLRGGLRRSAYRGITRECTVGWKWFGHERFDPGIGIARPPCPSPICDCVDENDLNQSLVS